MPSQSIERQKHRENFKKLQERERNIKRSRKPRLTDRESANLEEIEKAHLEAGRDHRQIRGGSPSIWRRKELGFLPYRSSSHRRNPSDPRADVLEA